MPFEVLLQQLDDADEDVRENAAWILGQLCVKDAVPALVQTLNSTGSPDLRRTAAVALGRMRDPRISPDLVQWLEHDPDRMVRAGCIIGLAMLKDPTTIPSLRHVMDAEQDPLLRTCLAEAIKTVSSVQHKHRSALEKKIEKCRRDVGEHPDSGPAHNNLAVAYYHYRQYDLAIQHCDRAKTLGTGVAWLEDRLREYRKHQGRGQG
jgi:tetratricopeptide (TPR) repeat protein